MSTVRPGVVFDCMIFLQAAARRTSPAGACPALAEQRHVQLYVSPAILDELRDVLCRPQSRSKFQQLTAEVVNAFLVRIQQISIYVEKVESTLTLTRDPKDEAYLSLAVACEADFLVSRGRDLLDSLYLVSQIRPHLQIVDSITILAALRGNTGSQA